jgi:hypothetical protein
VNIPWPVFVILVPALFLGLLAICLAPSKLENITGLSFQGALVGIEVSICWWLAGSGSSPLTRLLIDALVGLFGIGALWHIVLVVGTVVAARHEHLSGGRR